MQGRFITTEGGEGAGKSTNLQFIQELLESYGLDVVLTREPGGTPLGEDLRNLLLGHQHTGMADATELLLMFAARAEHLAAKINPALKRGAWVLCDRFTDATFAYQGGGRGMDMTKISALEDWVQGGLRPDLTLLLDLPVDMGLARATKRSAPDRFETEQITFFEKVRSSYLEIARSEPDRVKIVDASLPLQQVQASIQKILEEYLQQMKVGR